MGNVCPCTPCTLCDNAKNMYQHCGKGNCNNGVEPKTDGKKKK